MPLVLVGLGANLGRRGDALDASLEALAGDAALSSVVASPREETTAVGGPAGQQAYLNAVARCETDLSPERVLERLQAIEQRFGRDRAARWSARTLDLDLLAYGDLVLRSAELRLPHPRLSFRPFVLAPAARLAPDWRHPELGATLAELLATLTGGADEARLVGESADSLIDPAAAERLVTLERGGARFTVRRAGAGDGDRPAPRLTIDLRAGPPPGPMPAGPRLALADAPPAHWRDEARAALRCVWPELG